MGFFRFFESGMSMRQTTLQKVLTGQMNPIERRLKILERRQRRLFENEHRSTIEASSMEDDSDEGNEEAQATQVGPTTLGKVDVGVESPTKDQVRAANAVARKYPSADQVALSEDHIEVSQSSGSDFDLEIAEVLERELGILRESETTDSSAPSMSEVVQKP